MSGNPARTAKATIQPQTDLLLRDNSDVKAHLLSVRDDKSIKRRPNRDALRFGGHKPHRLSDIHDAKPSHKPAVRGLDALVYANPVHLIVEFGNRVHQSVAPETGLRHAVTVTNAEEPGTVKVSNLRPQVGTQLVAEVSDPDQDVSGVTWQWWRSTEGDDTTAATTVPDIANFDDITADPPANRRGDGNPGTGWEKVPGGTSSSYRPVSDDTGKFLLAIATYADGKANKEDEDRTHVGEKWCTKD